MKHKNAEMIMAKIDNMELVVFYRLQNEEWWQPESDHATLPDDIYVDYFLCLPKHKEAVLNCLNGGESEVFGGSGNFARGDAFIGSSWNSCSLLWYMNDACESRIKPKKEKRWIGVYKNGATTDACLLKNEAKNHPIITDVSANDWQFIEIEVEV